MCFFGLPHLARALAGILIRFCRHPRPARAFSGRLPIHLCRRPPPRPRPRMDTHIPRRHPHPTRAFGAPPPLPPRGRGPCVAIPGGQPYPALLQVLPTLWTVWISPRGEGPTGRGNLFPLPCLSRSRHLAPYQPYPARPSAGRLPIRFCRHPRPARAFSGRLPMHFCRQPPPRPRFHGDTRALLPATPTPPAPSALLPRPLLGAGSVRGDIR